MPWSSNLFLSIRYPNHNPVCTSPRPHTCYMPRPFHSSRFDHLNNIWQGFQSTELVIVYFSLLPFYNIPLRPKYSLQHPILKHPQPTFLNYPERPSFTPIRNNSQNYSNVSLNLNIFGYKTARQMILHWIIANIIPWLESQASLIIIYIYIYTHIYICVCVCVKLSVYALMYKTLYNQ